MKKIVLTGGGSAGHVYPCLALLPALKKAGLEIHYIGSHSGIEREAALSAGITYHSISTGKLRRYFSRKNFADFFRVLRGVFGALKILRSIRPDIIFSKGGYVVVPVVLAARLLGIRLIIHESDITPGLASRICLPFATHICVSFPQTYAWLKSRRAVLTGIPLRHGLDGGARSYGLAQCGFEAAGKPVVLVMGGSLGAAALNACVVEALPEMLKFFRVMLLTGVGNKTGTRQVGFCEFEYVQDMADIFAAADLVICRAGATTLFELLALRLPALVVPLPKTAVSRGDQLQNADAFARAGYVRVLTEHTPARLAAEAVETYKNRAQYIEAMEQSPKTDAAGAIVQLILRTLDL